MDRASDSARPAARFVRTRGGGKSGSRRKITGVAGGARWPARRREGRGNCERKRARETRRFAVRGNVPLPRRHLPRPRPCPCPSAPSCLGQPRRRPGREVPFARDRTRVAGPGGRAGSALAIGAAATCGRTVESRGRALEGVAKRGKRADQPSMCVTLATADSSRYRNRAASFSTTKTRTPLACRLLSLPRARATRGRRAWPGGAWRRMTT